MPTAIQGYPAAGGYQRTRDPPALWPALSEGARVGALHELECVTRAVLASARARVAPQEAHDSYALGIAAHTAGIGALLGRWITVGGVSTRPDVAAAHAA
jgi:hypothetical protein